MPISIPPVPVARDQIAILVTSTVKATPTNVAETSRVIESTKLLGITVSNIKPPGQLVQVWVGVRRDGSSGSNWEAILSPYLNGGSAVSFNCSLEIGGNDEVVAYADVALRATVTVEIEDEAE